MITRALLLFTSVVLALTPLTVLLEPTWSIAVSALASGFVLAAGAVARKLAPGGGLSAVIQLGVLALGVGVLSTALLWAQQPGQLVMEPSRFFAIIDTSAQQLSASVPPVVPTAELTIMLAIVIGLVTLLVDILVTDLKWRTAAAIALLAVALVPALHVGAQAHPAAYAGPIAGAVLVLALDALGTRPIPAATVTALTLAATIGLAPTIAPALTMGVKPTHPLTIDMLRNQNAGPGGVMINDTVSVRRTLNEREERTIAFYEATDGKPQYLRARVLTRFDGSAFAAPTTADIEKARSAAQSPTDTLLRNDHLGPKDERGNPAPLKVTVEKLTSDRVPVPSGLRQFGGSPDFDPQAAPASFGEVSVRGGTRVLDGQPYYADAESGTPKADQLRAVTAADMQAPNHGASVTGKVPLSLSTLAEKLKRESGAATPLDTALTYQAYFHTFDYSLSNVTPAGADPIESFLKDRSGYCEQFAASFALMMASQGYPSRVVVGFTGGTPHGAGYRITNRDAHAWPEVWFGEKYGWVRFEPTPSDAGQAVAAPPGLSSDIGDDNSKAPTPSAGTTAPSATPDASMSAAPNQSAASGSPSESDTAGTASASPAEGSEGAGHNETSRRNGAAAKATKAAVAAARFLAPVLGILVAVGALALTLVRLAQIPRQQRSLDTAHSAAASAVMWGAAHGAADQLGQLSDTARTSVSVMRDAALAAGIPIAPHAEPGEVMRLIAAARPCIGPQARALAQPLMAELYARSTQAHAQGRAAESHALQDYTEQIVDAIKNGCEGGPEG